MTLPWVSRALLNAAEDRALRAEAQLILTESKLASQAEAHERALAVQAENFAQAQRILQNQYDAEHADNKILLDRIVQLSGQPPIFHPLPTPAIPPAAPKEVSTMPGPETRVNFSDVHKAARTAIKEGKIGIMETP